MSNLSTFYPAPITAADLGLGAGSNATFGSIQNTPIGNTTPAAGSFTTLSASTTLNVTTAGSAAAGTGATFTHGRGNANDSVRLLFQPRGTAFSSAANAEILCTGVSGPFAQLSFRCNNSERMRLSLETPNQTSAGVIFAENIAFGSGGTMSPDVLLFRSAADTLELRRTTNPQTFRLYNTFTDASNHERGFMRWSSNVLQIGTEKAGTGSARALELQVDGTTRLAIASNGGVTVSAGLVGTGNIRASSFSCGTANNGISFGDGFTFITGPSTAGVLTINAFNNTDVLVRLGGTSSSWPALNTSGSTLRIRLADNSGFAPLSCGALTLNGNLDASTHNIVTDTTTGTKIGTATTQKIGFFNATPVVQQAAIADATDAATTQARLNDLLATMRTFGLIAT